MLFGKHGLTREGSGSGAGRSQVAFRKATGEGPREAVRQRVKDERRLSLCWGRAYIPLSRKRTRSTITFTSLLPQVVVPPKASLSTMRDLFS